MTNAVARGRADQLGWQARVVLYLVMLFASLSYNFSFIIIDYIRPFLVRDLGMTLDDTALLYTCQGLGVLIGSFAAPALVTRWGARKTLILASSGMAAFTGVSLFATSYAGWATMRFCVGLTLAGSYVSSVTMLANFFAPRIRARLLAINGAMFSVALLIAGFIGVLAGDSGWHALIQLATIAAMTVAVLVLLWLPDDRHFSVYGDAETATDENITRGKWSEMFIGRRRSLTIICLILAGLNFSGYQFYSGFITTYLMNVRHFDASVTGSFVSIDGAGMLIGSLLWGWVADFKGRRINAVGFGVAALFIALFLVAPPIKALLYGLEFGYAVCLSATSCWATYFAELFPVRLRPMGTSLFHGGHLVSLLAPLIVATVAKRYSLSFGMALAPLTFLAAAMLWWRLPETLRSSPLYRGFTSERATNETA